MIAQKYRPRKFTDVVGQDLVKENLMAQSKRNLWSQVYILGGQFGSGKTTLARIIAMAVNCRHKDENGNPCGKCPACKAILSGTCSDILEVDAASNTGVENVRKLIELSGYATTVVDKRVFIIDEVHRLSAAAFESLLKLLEEPPEHCVFILATTDVEKIPRTVQSRACKYTFGRIPEQLISGHLAKVAAAEGISITKGACDVIARASDGALRNAMMFLERVSFAGISIDEDAVNDIIGTTNDVKTAELVNAIAAYEKESLVKQVHEFALVGKNFYTLIGEMIEVMSDLILDFCHAEISCSTAYRDKLSAFNGGLDKRARLSNHLILAREKVRDNASESTFLSLLLKSLTDLEEEFAPKPKSAGIIEETSESETVSVKGEFVSSESRPISEDPENIEPTAKEEKRNASLADENPFGFDMFSEDSFFNDYEEEPKVSEDPFAAFSTGENKEIPSVGETEEIVHTEKRRTVVIPGIAMDVEIEDVPFDEEETDEESDIPKVLRVEGLSKEAAQALEILKRECGKSASMAEAICSSKIEFNDDGVSITPGSIGSMKTLMNLTMLEDDSAEYIFIEQCAANA